MNEVTQILAAIDAGNAEAVSQLLPMVYHELRQLASIHMSKEFPGHTLNATALVHEVYLRMVKPGSGSDSEPTFANRKHFFLAASESMRKILVDHARRKGRIKRGGASVRKPLQDLAQTLSSPEEVIMIDEVLDKFAEKWPRRAELLKLRIFAGCTIPECAKLLGISESTAEDNWTYARAWLRREWKRNELPDSDGGNATE